MSDQDRSHHQTEASPHKAHVDEPDHGGVKIYWYVFGALVVLTMASFFTYSPYWPFKETPSVGWAFMMAVSCTKASLVMMFFMHLLYDNKIYMLIFVGGLTFLSFFFILTLFDTVHRGRVYTERDTIWTESEIYDQLRANPETVRSIHGHGDAHGDDAHGDAHGSDAHDEAHGSDAHDEAEGHEARHAGPHGGEVA